MSSWRVTAASEVAAVDTAALSAHVRITHYDDVVLMEMEAAARAQIEEYTSRALTTQTWQLVTDDFDDRMWLPRAAPYQSGLTVTYYDANNTLQTLASTYYQLVQASEPARLERAIGQSWPVTAARSDAVQISYVCGWAEGADVPAPLRHAIKLLVGHWYGQRESHVVGGTVAELPLGVEALCAPFRVWVPEC